MAEIISVIVFVIFIIFLCIIDNKKNVYNELWRGRLK